VDVVLGQAGSAKRAGDAPAGYSHGMRQRLGVAAGALSSRFTLSSARAKTGRVQGA
jgi:ABC-type multidrug transport system ATPase subunit